MFNHYFFIFEIVVEFHTIETVAFLVKDGTKTVSFFNSSLNLILYYECPQAFSDSSPLILIHANHTFEDHEVLCFE